MSALPTPHLMQGPKQNSPFRTLLRRLPAVAVWWLIAICAVVITVAIEWSALSSDTTPGNEWLRDHFVRLHASSADETRIALVDIDEESIVALGRWPWSRERVASIIEHLVANYGVRGVALDLYFSEPADPEGDLRLAVLAEHGPVVMAQVFDYGNTPIRIGQLFGGMPIDNAGVGTSSPTATNNLPKLPIPLASGYIANHAGLARAAHVGNIGFIPDADGVLRHLPPLTQFEGRVYPTLSRVLFDCCSRPANAVQRSALPVQSVVNANGFMRVPYRHQLSSFNVSKATDIFNLRTPKEYLEGKLVIVGSSSLNLSDRVATPLSPSTNGFLVHASALSGLLDEQEGIAPRPLPGRWIAVIFSIGVAVLGVLAFPRLSALSNIGILLGASAVWLGLAFYLQPHDDLFAPAGPLYAHLFLLIVAVPLGWQMTQSKSRRLLDTLQQYVAKAVVDQLLLSDLKDPLAPRQLHVTTLIADMEAYTSHVESLPIQDAASLTTAFLECLTAPVLAHGGTLDKYTGDGLVAFWGAPLPQENHADLALDAARQILQNVREFNQRRAALGLRAVRVRIGMETGIAMAGDFGTKARSIYTAVGDSVNVASRLEDIARDYPFDLIIGQGTVSASRSHQFTQLGERFLKGKELPLQLYTLEGLEPRELVDTAKGQA